MNIVSNLVIKMVEIASHIPVLSLALESLLYINHLKYLCECSSDILLFKCDDDNDLIKIRMNL